MLYDQPKDFLKARSNMVAALIRAKQALLDKGDCGKAQRCELGLPEDLTGPDFYALEALIDNFLVGTGVEGHNGLIADVFNSKPADIRGIINNLRSRFSLVAFNSKRDDRAATLTPVQIEAVIEQLRREAWSAMGTVARTAEAGVISSASGAAPDPTDSSMS